MNIFMWIFCGGVAVALAAIGYRLLRFPEEGLKTVFSYRTLGQIEGSLPDLERVIVVAHRVEEPTHELREAVKLNFRRGLKYLFLVSQSTAEEELLGYYKIFRALAEIETKKSATDLVDIQELPYDWPNFPYVFYETRARGTAEPSFVAFRGNQKQEGIANFYSPVEGPNAYILARAVLSDSPHPIGVRSEQFEEAAKVLPFPEEHDRATHSARL